MDICGFVVVNYRLGYLLKMQYYRMLGIHNYLERILPISKWTFLFSYLLYEIKYAAKNETCFFSMFSQLHCHLDTTYASTSSLCISCQISSKYAKCCIYKENCLAKKTAHWKIENKDKP